MARPLSARQAERRFAKNNCKRVGFYPFRGPAASLYAKAILTQRAGRRHVAQRPVMWCRQSSEPRPFGEANAHLRTRERSQIRNQKLRNQKMWGRHPCQRAEIGRAHV